jgi:predicted nucleic-acid-binding Zn-ribbon protein
MKIAECRNCGSDERYRKEVNAAGGYGPNLLPVGWVGWSGPKFEIEVCGGCGLIEWFVPQRLLPKVKETFSRVSKS